MGYRCEAATPEGLVQQLAVSYLRHGYFFYVTGWVKPPKDPRAVDAKLISRYAIAISDRERARRKLAGFANMQYLRHHRWFILLATEGYHEFKQLERRQLQDCRRVSIKFEGYSISYRRSGLTPKGGGPPKWHAHVRIDRVTYRQLQAFFLERACWRTTEELAGDFARVPYARYAPVRRQLFNILNVANDARARQGLDPVHHSALKLRRVIVQPFGGGESPADAPLAPDDSGDDTPHDPTGTE